MDSGELATSLALSEIKTHTWHIQACSALKGVSKSDTQPDAILHPTCLTYPTV